MDKGNEEKPGLSASMGPWDLGGLYALKGGTLRWWHQVPTCPVDAQVDSFPILSMKIGFSFKKREFKEFR
jgi:hypothetical protein